MSDKRALFLAKDFVISCGTVSIDPASSVLLAIKCNKSGEVFLPKGRKNIGETLEAAALRETFEETGYAVELLPISTATNATFKTRSPESHTEPIAVTQRGRQISKIIFWYVAKFDSTKPQIFGTQDDGEDYTTLLLPFGAINEVVTFEDDQNVCQAAIDAMHQQSAVSI